jgi:acetylglutamate kinase
MITRKTGSGLMIDFYRNDLLTLINGGYLEARLLKSDQTARVSIKERVEGRMKRKILAIRKLFDGGDTTVIISDGRTEHPILDAIEGKGTTIS